MTDPFAAFTDKPAPPFDPESPGSFLGRGLAWPLRENPDTGDFLTAEGLQSVEESLRHLIRISFMEIPGLERMGTNADDLLFENDPNSARDLFIFSAKQAITSYETRVDLLDIRFQLTPLDTQGNRYGANILVRYRVKATGDVTQKVFPFNLTISGELL